MLVQGQIIAIMPPNFQDSWGNQYQDVTVRTAQGDITGQKASKMALTENDVGNQVVWNCDVKQNSRGQDYNKFIKLQDPQYASQGSPQRPQSSTQRPNTPQTRNYDAENRGKVRTQFIKAAIIAGTLKCNCWDDVLTLTEFAMTGIDPTKAKSPFKTNPNYVGDDPPPPTDDDIPF
ncbi:unnamed protein product [marine sediment metagenome]|uniref:Uncharacterized protein n=1 Tax=marine sediment metagenome TaxID=412755 RepID=X1GL39_9ZZZZ